MSDQVAALIAVAVLAGLVVFQLLLAAGRPLGEYAWGGAHRVLPRWLRIASLVATGVYAIAALIILEAANVIEVGASPDLSRAAVWALTAFFALGVPLNAISRSR